MKEKNKIVTLPDGTEISQEELDKMDERRWWGKAKKESVLGQKHK